MHEDDVHDDDMDADEDEEDLQEFRLEELARSVDTDETGPRRLIFV
jgi:uncharacterized protein YjbI with pentapeptide repeats